MEEENDDSKMKVTLSKGIWKYSLLFLDNVISLVAVAIMTFGVVALGVAGSKEGAYALAALGAFVMGVSFLGFFASVRESHMLCISYIGLSIACIVMNFCIMISLFIMKSTLINSTRDRIDTAWRSNQKEMDILQSQYYCCGKNHADDYATETYMHGNRTLPTSCCKLDNCDDEADIFTQGCTMAALKIFENQTDFLMLSIVLTIILKVFSVVIAYYYAKVLRAPAEKTEEKPIAE